MATRSGWPEPARPYLSLFNTVATSRVWPREVAAGDGAHPNQGDDVELADAFLQWPAWQGWVG